jgi:3-hydroxyacyl-[acyl-carrier-protein] dehydratase
VSGIFIFPADFPAFGGHFPGRPVLPAIIQLAAVTHMAGLALGAEVRPQHYQKTKFRAMIQPGDEIHVEIKMELQGSGWTGIFSLRHKTGELVSSGSVHY